MRISDWSSDVCSSDLEGRSGKSDGKAENDLNQAAKPARGLAKGKREAGRDDDDHGDDLRHWSLYRFQHLLQRLLPGHAGAGGMRGGRCHGKAGGENDDNGARAATDGSSEEHTSELQSLKRNSSRVFC